MNLPQTPPPPQATTVSSHSDLATQHSTAQYITDTNVMQTDTQLRILVKTTASKLSFKLSKSRTLSKHTISTAIVPELRQLATLGSTTHAFERALDILKMKLAQLVRNDRAADVWEDLVGELAVLESSLHLLSGMIERQKTLNVENVQIEAQKRKRMNGKNKQQGGSGSSGGWSFLGFTWTTGEDSTASDSASAASASAGADDQSLELQYQPIDRLSKVIRNVLVAQEYLGDDVHELKKLAVALAKCIDKEYLVEHAPPTTKPKIKAKTEVDTDTETTEDEPQPLDIEDRVYAEIVRKLRGDDEEAVVNDYLHELCDVFQIDIYGEGKYITENKETQSETEAGTEANQVTTAATAAPPKLDDLDELKKRFQALKKSGK